MVSLETHVSQSGDVTLVQLLVTAESPTRVRVDNCLDGPVWPPRRQGVPAEGWDDEGYEGVVRDRLVLGYATPADPADPPARVVSESPVDGGQSDDAPTPEQVVRSLGDARPPGDAVPRADPDPAPDRSVTDGPSTDRSAETASQPAELTDWLDAVEDRIAAAERLAAASSVPEATAAVEAVGDVDAVSDLQERLAADREALARMQARCGTLSERADAVEIPVETLARLA